MNDYLNQISQRFINIAPNVDFWTLRLSDESQEAICVRQGVMQPVYNQLARGALVTVVIGDGCGYAATSDLSDTGLRRAARQASDWAKQCSVSGLLKVWSKNSFSIIVKAEASVSHRRVRIYWKISIIFSCR